uniref:Secreted protein n=1 Tax=Panagrellus redivivus TaxID=6233 RepID=A0A7E4ZYR1_PANRE
MKVVHLIFIVGLIALVVEGSSRCHRGRLAHRREYEADDDEALDRPVHYNRRASDYDGVIRRGYRNRNVRKSRKRLNKYGDRYLDVSNRLNMDPFPQPTEAPRPIPHDPRWDNDIMPFG